MIDLETDAGQLRLLHLAEYRTIPPPIRARITRHFHATRFERLVPAWRDRLARVDASLDRVERFLSSLWSADALRTLELLGLHA
jgi:hypothetical protein